MKTIKSVSSKSIAKLSALMHAVFGFIAGIFFLLISLLASNEESGVVALIFGLGAPIALPIFYGLMGWIGGYIVGWVYNLLAKRVGGIQVEIE